MARDQDSLDNAGWLEASGLPQILRTLGFAAHPAKLGIGLAGIFVTIVLGGLLDLLWTSHGVGSDAISLFIQSRTADMPYEEPTGSTGIFEVWRQHEQRCVVGFLGSALPGSSMAAGTPLASFVNPHTNAGPLGYLVGMIYGVWWLFSYHTLFFLLFTIGALLIWSYCGGAICRIAAVQMARDEKLTMQEALSFSRERLFGGFLLAPCLPLVFVLVTLILLALGGVFLRIPILGDLLGGLAFGLAIVGGFVIAILLAGLLIGGSFLWPAVAVEGSDAFDAFSRSLSYPLSKPWKWLLYTVILGVLASVCWIIVNLFTYLTLLITRTAVGFGTSPFGWWSRDAAGVEVSKLKMLWPLSGPGALRAWPETQGFAWWEFISAFLISVWVLLIVGLVWSFLVSFYFSGSTVIYYLLRRDVDGIDLDEIYVDEEEEEEGDALPDQVSTVQPAQSESGGVVSLPVISGTPPVDPPSAENETPKTS